MRNMYLTTINKGVAPLELSLFLCFSFYKGIAPTELYASLSSSYNYKNPMITLIMKSKTIVATNKGFNKSTVAAIQILN